MVQRITQKVNIVQFPRWSLCVAAFMAIINYFTWTTAFVYDIYPIFIVVLNRIIKAMGVALIAVCHDIRRCFVLGIVLLQ